MDLHLMSIGRIVLGFMFVYAGICNIYYAELKTKVIAERNIPFPKYVLWLGISTQILAGLAVIFHVYLIPATVLLILFNFCAAYLFHNFWNVSGDAYRLKMQGFINNMGFFGALLILLGIS